MPARQRTRPPLSCTWPRCRLPSRHTIMIMAMHFTLMFTVGTLVLLIRGIELRHKYHSLELELRINSHDSEVFDYRSGNFTMIGLVAPNVRWCGWKWYIVVYDGSSYSDRGVTAEQQTRNRIMGGYRSCHGWNCPDEGQLIAYIFTRDADHTVRRIEQIFAKYWFVRQWPCQCCSGYDLDIHETRRILRENDVPFIAG
jgi:hypothetical protein